MKNKIIYILFISLLITCSFGCGNKNITKVAVAGPRVVCTMSEVLDGIPTDTTIVTKFDENNYINYRVTETVQTFEDVETYRQYANELKSSNNENEDMEEYYELDEDNKKITVTLVYKESMFDYSDIDPYIKEDYLASHVIYELEDDGAECKYLNVNKADLGINK